MEWLTTDDGKYTIKSLSAETFPGALEVIRESFFKDELVAIGCGLNENPVAAEESLELCADVALNGVSLVAVENSSGAVAAAAFNTLQVAVPDSEKPFFEIFAEQRCTQEPSRASCYFMTNIDGRCNLFQKYGVDCSLEIMYLATLREHRHRRLAELLCKTSIELARKLKNGPITRITVQDLGPKYSHMKPRSVTTKHPKICQAIWTCESTKKIGKKLNFTVHLKVPLDEFVYKGKTYAERINMNDAFCEIAAILL